MRRHYCRLHSFLFRVPTTDGCFHFFLSLQSIRLPIAGVQVPIYVFIRNGRQTENIKQKMYNDRCVV